MARKRLKKKKPAAHKKSLPDGTQLLEYEITEEPIHDRAYSKLPGKVRDTLEEMHVLAQTRPREAIPELERLRQRYPHIPAIYNYLSVAYTQAGETEKGTAIIRENYEKNSDYLFAKVNYAQVFLHQKNYDKVAEIFDHTFDLSLLYPNRRRFHISEYMGFMGVVANYHIGTGEREIAEHIYEMMKQIQPKHPYTRQLRRELHPGFLMRWLKRLASE